MRLIDRSVLALSLSLLVVLSGCEGDTPKPTKSNEGKAAQKSGPGDGKAEDQPATKAESDSDEVDPRTLDANSHKFRIPPPSELTTKIVTSGRTTKIEEVEIVDCGKNIPFTYSRGKVSNSPGFRWYVTKHFAFKSDLSKENIRHYLELVEASWPHYVELFGGEPPNAENQRIAVVYGSTRAKVRDTMLDDGFLRGVHATAGGETMFYNLAGYNFPSAREQHRRYIVIHETAHAFQMALTEYSGWMPNWYGEGVADGIAHHVYDPGKKELTVFVFDRAPMDYVRIGLKQYIEDGKPSIKDLHRAKRLRRGINFLLVHYLLDDPIRTQKFKIFRDEMFARREVDKQAEVADEIFSSLFPDWDKFEKDFADWVAYVGADFQKTFNLSGGPWEQDGNAFWVRTYNLDQGMPRLDINLRPADKPTFKPFHMDYPASDVPQTVGKIVRGVKSPSVGFEIDYVTDHVKRSRVGMALGVKVLDSNKDLQRTTQSRRNDDTSKGADLDADEQFRILIENGDTIAFEAPAMGIERNAFALPPSVARDLRKSKDPKLGVNVLIGEGRLVVRVEVANTGDHPSVGKRSIDITPEIREKLMSRPMALLAEGVSHRITPFFDDGRNLDPYAANLDVEAPANPWRNRGDHALARLVRAQWALGAESKIEQLDSLIEVMGTGASKSRVEQRAELLKFRKAREQIAAAVAGTSSPNKGEAIRSLSGVKLRLEWQKDSDMVKAVLTNPSELPVKGSIVVTAQGSPDKPVVTVTKDVAIEAEGRFEIEFTPPKAPSLAKKREGAMNPIEAVATLEWAGQSFETTQRSLLRQWPGVTMRLSGHRLALRKDRGFDLRTTFTGPFGGKTTGTIRYEILPRGYVEGDNDFEVDFSIEPMEAKEIVHPFRLKKGAKVPKRGFTVSVTADMVADGEELRLRERTIVAH